MAAKAVVVHDDLGPIEGAEVAIGGAIIGLTNDDGYVLAPMPFGEEETYVRVLATQYFPSVQLVSLDDENQEIHFGAPGGPDNTIHVPALVTFVKPTPPIPPLDPNDPALFIQPPGNLDDVNFQRALIVLAKHVAYHAEANEIDFNYWLGEFPGMNARGIQINIPNYGWLRLIGWQATGADMALYGPYRAGVEA